MRTRLALFALTLSGLASASDYPPFARYEVPTQYPALKAHATFSLPVKDFDVDAESKNMRLRVEMPETLVGQEPYEVEFRGTFVEDAIFVLRAPAKASGQLTHDKTKPLDHMLSCAYAREEASLSCLAKWHYIKDKFDAAWLRERLVERDPHISAETLAARLAVASRFSGDGIGVLNLNVGLP
ncbi:MAG TPA: hypothetical protein VM901_09580 [Bdellovibrionota bacterium]|jgi:hypothetical protein|nr:hypothetical protein [Bdellovibrionota bacterium]